MANKKRIISRKDEIGVIGYKIPNTDDIIIGRIRDKYEWLVNTSSGIINYSTNEMKEIYNIDMKNSNFERIGMVM